MRAEAMGILNLFRRAAQPAGAAPDGSVRVRPTGSATAAGPELLLPVLRSRWAVAMQQLADSIRGVDEGHVDALGLVGSDLAIDLCADNGGSPAIIAPEQLRQLGLDRTEALDLAAANLRRRSDANFTALGPGVFVSGWGDGYDSSRLLFPETTSMLPVNGDPVAMVPVRGMLVLTGADDRRGLLMMAAAAAEALSTSGEPLSAQPLHLRDGRWMDFTADPIAFAALHDLRRGQLTREYAEQKELLDELHAQQGADVFVANYAPMQDRRSRRLFCMTFWADGISSLLPRADAIAFKTAAEVIVVPWDAAMPIVGHRMTPTEHYPGRIRVETFPGAAELERLTAVAILAKPVKPA
jgi:hypothetical protein